MNIEKELNVGVGKTSNRFYRQILSAGQRTINESVKAFMHSQFLLVLIFILLASVYAPQECFAQNTEAVAASNKGVQILFLGTAGGPPLHLDRSEPSTLLIVDGHRYLIDCGTGTIRRLLQAGIRSETIKTIFITHHHPDHDIGLVDVMSNDVWASLHRNIHINIYGPPQTKEMVRLAFKYISIPLYNFGSGSSSHKISNPFTVHEFSHNGLVYQDDEIRVTAVENTHYILMAPEYRKKRKSYSYRFKTPYGVIVFTGDTGPSDAVIKLAEGADLLVSEVCDTAIYRRGMPEYLKKHFEFEHLSERAVGEMATKAKVKAVILYHFSPTDGGVAPETFVDRVKKYYSGPVFASADLQRYSFNARADTSETKTIVKLDK